jgi:hypothetical protein
MQIGPNGTRTDAQMVFAVRGIENWNPTQGLAAMDIIPKIERN